VLLNLLNNSIKFTNEGKITLILKIKQGKDEGSNLVAKFIIKDTGMGIEHNRHKNIFNLFEKDENVNIDSYLDLKDRTAKIGLPLS